jgi:hypothetical protein
MQKNIRKIRMTMMGLSSASIAAWLYYLTLAAVLAPKCTSAFHLRQAPKVPSRCQPLRTAKDDNLPDGATFHRDRPSSRRKILREAAHSVVGACVLLPSRATAESAVPESNTIQTSVPIRASWTAINGLNANDQFVQFDAASYRAMKDDPTRTPLFQQAIFNRLGKNPESLTVIDLGTGPVALFAIMAAQLGAGRVYAMEANRAAAQSARATIQRAGFQDVITVLDGFSTDIELPNQEKADFCIAEIIGSIATEEGAYATIRDAHKRFLKNPDLPSSWIPRQIQTYAAPASYTLHNLFGPPEFDWNKLNGEPVRFNCRDKGLELLADPVLVEDVSFGSIWSRDQESALSQTKQLEFVVDAERMQQNEIAFYDEFLRGKSAKQDSLDLAKATAHSLSGIALWPRLVLDESTFVDSRHYGDGVHQRSHWQTVLPIMSGRPVGELKGGEKVSVTAKFELSADVLKPCRYSLDGTVTRS